MNTRWFLIGLSCFFYCSSVLALQLRSDHPKEYVVQPGDTLWKVAGAFLESPWEWRDLWHQNPQIDNPDRIYPGDVLQLSYVNGKARLMVTNRGPVKLTPKLDSAPIDNAIPPIPLEYIRPFLNESLVIEYDELKYAPYIFAIANDHLIAAEGNTIYAMGPQVNDFQAYAIYRETEPYVDPETTQVLGYSALHVGDAYMVQEGHPATLRIRQSNQEIEVGDKLYPRKDYDFSSYFYPKAPNVPVFGNIISVFGGMTEIGQYNVITLNRGRLNGLEVGDVLVMIKPGKIVKTRISRRKGDVKLPNETIGELIVFRVFDHMSFGLVLHATQSANISDKVASPGEVVPA